LIRVSRRGDGDDLEAERLAHVFGGRSEDLPVDIDQAIAPTMPGLPSDGSGDGVPPRVPDPLVQLEVADRVRDHRRTEHLALLHV
jgi:hypothetical protein